MQSDNRFLDDLAKLANGAAGALTAARSEAEGAFRAWLDRRLEELDLVTREEFEAVREMAARAREDNTALAERIAALESQLSKTGATARKRTASKSRGGTKSKAQSGGKSSARRSKQ